MDMDGTMRSDIVPHRDTVRMPWVLLTPMHHLVENSEMSGDAGFFMTPRWHDGGEPRD